MNKSCDGIGEILSALSLPQSHKYRSTNIRTDFTGPQVFLNNLWQMHISATSIHSCVDRGCNRQEATSSLAASGHSQGRREHFGVCTRKVTCTTTQSLHGCTVTSGKGWLWPPACPYSSVCTVGKGWSQMLFFLHVSTASQDAKTVCCFHECPQI